MGGKARQPVGGELLTRKEGHENDQCCEKSGALPPQGENVLSVQGSVQDIHKGCEKQRNCEGFCEGVGKRYFRSSAGRNHDLTP